MPPLGKFIPLSLPPSKIISLFFDFVSYACENPAEKDAPLRVTSERVHDGPTEMKTWSIEINTPDRYNILLDVASTFLGCSETSKCFVRVSTLLGR